MKPHIGMPLWFFDDNRRVYKTNENGRPYGGPIWREHWRKVEIIGETRISWIIAYEGSPFELTRIKKKEFPGHFATSEEQINEQAYIVVNRKDVIDALYRLQDYAKFKAIEEVLNR